MRDTFRKTATQCVEILLRPAARMCLKHSIGFREFSLLCKSAFIDEAKRELEKRGIAPSATRLSVMTGLQRRDVAERGDDSPLLAAEHHASLCNRVIGQWLSDRRFLTSKKQPKPLSVAGKNSEFAKLLRSVSSDPNHYAVLYELERIGAVERDKEKITLVVKAYTPRANITQGYVLLSEDISALTAAVEENLLGESEILNLHAKTSYDNIDPADVPHLKKWLLKFGGKMHEEVRQFLSKYDRDVTPNSRAPARRARVTFGTFGVAVDESPADERDE